MIKDGDLVVMYVRSEDNLADIMMKNTKEALYIKHVAPSNGDAAEQTAAHNQMEIPKTAVFMNCPPLKKGARASFSPCVF